MDKYKVKIQDEEQKESKIPETPFCFKNEAGSYMVFEQSGDKNTLWVCGLKEGNCSSWGKKIFYNTMDSCASWKLIESTISFD